MEDLIQNNHKYGQFNFWVKTKIDTLLDKMNWCNLSVIFIHCYIFFKKKSKLESCQK